MRIFVAFYLLVVVGCVSQQKGPLPKAVNIELRGKPGEVTTTRYFSNGRILTYEGGQLVRDRTEGVDFQVASKMRAVNPNTKIMDLVVKTIAKDGTSSLHDLAFPELNEEIEFLVRPDGKVLRAGKYPEESLFFVPAIPVPGRSVEVGDTWTMTHRWYSAREGIPLQLEVVAILKDIVRCNKTEVCADIEISGRVGLVVQPVAKGSKFSSRIYGRMLFSIDRGDVLWSEMRSEEEMGVKGDRVSVRSCMISEVKTATPYKIKFECDPRGESVGKTPSF